MLIENVCIEKYLLHNKLYTGGTTYISYIYKELLTVGKTN